MEKLGRFSRYERELVEIMYKDGVAFAWQEEQKPSRADVYTTFGLAAEDRMFGRTREKNRF